MSERTDSDMCLVEGCSNCARFSAALCREHFDESIFKSRSSERTDSERLDWATRERCMPVYDAIYRWSIDFAGVFYGQMKSPREAIDAAMDAEGDE